MSAPCPPGSSHHRQLLAEPAFRAADASCGELQRQRPALRAALHHRRDRIPCHGRFLPAILYKVCGFGGAKVGAYACLPMVGVPQDVLSDLSEAKWRGLFRLRIRTNKSFAPTLDWTSITAKKVSFSFSCRTPGYTGQIPLQPHQIRPYSSA